MDIKYHLETAWQLCIANIISLVIITLVFGAVSFISLGILAPVAFAGYLHSILFLLRHDKEPSAQDIFSQMSLFLPLLVFSACVFIIALIGTTIFILPGVLFTLIVGYLCLYMVPVMVDKKFGLIDAIKKSIAMVTRTRSIDHIIVFSIFSALTSIGGGSIIGFLFLQPFATIFLLSAYEDTY